jgi:hypothetical protein
MQVLWFTSVILAPFAIAGAGSYFVYRASYDGYYPPIWLAALLAFVFVNSIGIILYWMREHIRIVYGFVEILAAWVIIFFTFGHQLESFADSKVWAVRDILAFWAPIAGALYVLVRGCDNFGQGMRAAGPTLRRVWNFFSLGS